MLLHEIVDFIKPLSHEEKIQLIQDVAEMLKPPSDAVLRRFEQAAEQDEPSNLGQLESYRAARQLREFIKHEGV